MKLAQAILQDELQEFDKKFKEAVKSQTPLLDRIMRFIVNRKGKQLRPMFVLLSAKLCGSITEASYRTASLVELLHTATLVHDDVVDESLERRNFSRPMPSGKTKFRCWWAIICWPKVFCYPLTTTILESSKYSPAPFVK